MKNTAQSWLILYALILNGCGGEIKIPDIEACAVAGLVAAGADCATTLSNRQRSMDLNGFLEFLEPRENKAAAICTSAVDFNKLKTALQQACEILGSDCKREIKEAIQQASKVLDKLEASSKAKAVNR